MSVRLYPIYIRIVLYIAYIYLVLTCVMESDSVHTTRLGAQNGGARGTSFF